jgi:hypothetical protein
MKPNENVKRMAEDYVKRQVEVIKQSSQGANIKKSEYKKAVRKVAQVLAGFQAAAAATRNRKTA